MSLLPVLKSPFRAGLNMPRDRHQTGWLWESGKKIPKWRGDYYVYERQPDGSEKRKHTCKILGRKSEMSKRQAERALRDFLIAQGAAVAVSRGVTLEWYWQQRYLPMQGPKLKPSSLSALKWVVEKHILPAFGKEALCDLTRFAMQMHLNKLAESKGESILHKVRTYLNALLAEAEAEGLVAKNTAKRLEMPRVQRKDRPFLSPEQAAIALSTVLGRDRLILRLLITCGLRPGELFALRWDDWTPGQLRIDEAVWNGKVSSPKTRASLACVFLPPVLECELAAWREQSGSDNPRDFIFATKEGNPFPKRIWLEDYLRPAIKHLGLQVDYRICRTTFSTLMQQHGTVKDVQRMMRHASPNLTVGTYMQAIPDSVRQAVSSLEASLEKPMVN